ncbi:MAG: hypothetical protein JST05_09375 [Acidobacteria bacterium]|nr:hypothetical protein [Acidobacteriota bacterium]
MAWDGVERRRVEASFNGLERRSAVKAQALAKATRLADVEVRDMAFRRRRAEAETWEAAEYLE